MYIPILKFQWYEHDKKNIIKTDFMYNNKSYIAKNFALY